jgi:hypothetical protein
MPPRRHSRSRPSRSRRSSSLSYLLVAVLVVGIGYLLLHQGIPPAPPNQTQQSPGTDGPAEDSGAIRRLGGTVDYGRVNLVTGQRSGIRALITPAMVAAAARDELGSAAASTIRPPGFDQLPTRNRARGHLFGRQLGGSGDQAANLVALYQTRANSPVMRDYETAVAEAVQAGQMIRYAVRPIYPSRTSNGAPTAIRITATGNRGFGLDVTIANTAEAAVKEAMTSPETP